MGPLLNLFKQQYECGWTGLNKGVSQLTGGAVLAPLGFLASFPSNQLWKQLGMVQIHQKKTVRSFWHKHTFTLKHLWMIITLDMGNSLVGFGLSSELWSQSHIGGARTSRNWCREKSYKKSFILFGWSYPVQGARFLWCNPYTNIIEYNIIYNII